jgi:hypothetical protein
MSPKGRPEGEYRSAKHEGSPVSPNLRLLQVPGWTTGTPLRRTLEMARNLDRLARGEPLNNYVIKG